MSEVAAIELLTKFFVSIIVICVGLIFIRLIDK